MLRARISHRQRNWERPTEKEVRTVPTT